MGNVKKTIGCLALTAIVSTSAFGMLSPAAQAADGSIPYVADTMAYTNSMTLDVAVTPYLFEDTNGDGFTNAGDTVNYVLKVTNTSDKDYTYVDVSGYKAGFERMKLADSLKAGETLTKDMKYVVRTDDLLETGGSAGSKLTVNVRDATQLETYRNAELAVYSELYDCNNVTEIVDSIINFCTDRVDPENARMESSNGHVVYDVETDTYYVDYAPDADKFFKSSGISPVIVNDLFKYVKPGNRVYSMLEILNGGNTDFTLTEVVNAYKLGDNNVIGATVKAGETSNLYFSETVDVDSMDWGFQNQLGSGTSVNVKTSGGKWITSFSGSASSRTTSSASTFIDMKFDDNKDGTFDVTYSYVGSNKGYTTLTPRAFVSSRFGSFDVTETFENGPITKQMPTIENVPELSVVDEKGYMISYGKYLGTLNPNPSASNVGLPMSARGFIPVPDEPVTPVDPVDPIIPVTPIDPVIPVTPIDPVVPVEIVTPELPIEPVPEVPVTKKFIQTGEVSSTSSSSENAGLIAMLVAGLATGALALAVVSGRVFRKRRAAHRA